MHESTTETSIHRLNPPGLWYVGDALKQAVGRLRRRLEILGNQDRNDERVNGDNAGHDDGDETLLEGAGQPNTSLHAGVPWLSHLHDQVRPVCSHARNADAGFRGAISCAHACRDESRQLSVGVFGGVAS